MRTDEHCSARKEMNMDSSTPKESRYFGAVAGTYDRLQPIIAGRSYGEALGIIVDLIPYDSDDTFEFVELGCGTGEPSMRVLQHFPLARGTCIDTEPEMLEIAKRKLASAADRADIRQADMRGCDMPPCDVVFSAKAFHHVSAGDLPLLLKRIVLALRPGGCFILYDHMPVGPQWGVKTREQSRRLYRRHIQSAIAAGQATQEEIDARWAFKKNMKAAGKDVEYRHTADEILDAMGEAGFAEVGIVWQMFADTILLGFTPDREERSAKPGASADMNRPRR
jgi:tRNA (cmo5U34)-methyltransferase